MNRPQKHPALLWLPIKTYDQNPRSSKEYRVTNAKYLFGTAGERGFLHDELIAELLQYLSEEKRAESSREHRTGEVMAMCKEYVGRTFDLRFMHKALFYGFPRI